MPRAGIVTVAGKPNAGKSTLLNRIVGEKLAIVSPKPQSTRDRIVGIHSTADAQIVLLDTPGLLDPRYALQRSMRATALAALRDADIILYLVDATSGEPEPLASVAGLDHPPRAPTVVAMNKLDLLGSSDRAALAARVPTLPSSAPLPERASTRSSLALRRFFPRALFSTRKTSSALRR